MKTKPHIMLARRGIYKCPVYICGLRVGPFRKCGKGVTPQEAYADWDRLMSEAAWRVPSWRK